MFDYILRRLGLMVLTLFGVSIAIFLLLRVVPGNIADILFDSAGLIDPAEKQQIVKDLGLDLPLVEQYTHWIVGLAHGDLGYSYVSEKPVLDEILPRIPITARLAGLALLFAVCTGVPFGVISAVRQNTGLDYVLRVFSLLFLSLPSFWLGLLVLMAFVNWFGLLPIYDKAPPTWGAFALMLCAPAATVGLRSSALIMRLTRSSMLEVMGQDYVRTARSKGLSEPAVTFIHALRNAVLPVITTIGIETAFLFGGLIVTETVFNIPGVARFLVEAIRWRDYPMVQNLVMFIAIIVVTVNLIVDIAYMFVDPRIRLRA
jgi:peptide/nickel transport system permease protein